MKSNRIFGIILVVGFFAAVGLAGMKIWHLDNKQIQTQTTEKKTLKEVGKDLFDLHEDILKEQVNSPIPMWRCGNPPTIVPKREDFQDIKEFQMAVADFRALSYAWMSCATEFASVYPSAVAEWGLKLIEDNEVIIQ